MVTKPRFPGNKFPAGYVLAKIQMVTKHPQESGGWCHGYVLAKIQMVTKPQINIIII